MLELTDVDVSYGGVRAVRGLTLTVGEGEIVALLGANGAGKTTTLSTISGLLRPSAGRITFDGSDLTRMSPAQILRGGVTHVPEGRRIFGNLTVHENLQLGGYTMKSFEKRIARMYELMPALAARKNQTGGTLSGGEQQMLAIARALVPPHRLLLLDEPSMGLAPRMVRTVLDLVRGINRDGTAVLLVEQNARAALRLAGRGYVLEVGRVAVSGTAAQLRADDRVIKADLGVEFDDGPFVT
jgi:branched-chain amino acid transport system ATP-binding protein